LTLKLKKGQRGVTGLETAIILIAFVMVASVFSYVILSSGLFSSQRTKMAVSAGLKETSDTLLLKGNVLGLMAAGEVTTIYLTLGILEGGGGIDFTDTAGGNNVVVISFSDAYQQYPNLSWTLTKLATVNSDDTLDHNELFQVTVDLTEVNAGAAAGEELTANHVFQIEIKPPVGAVLSIERTVPNRVSNIINMH
jgi:flagellin FlaB